MTHFTGPIIHSNIIFTNVNSVIPQFFQRILINFEFFVSCTSCSGYLELIYSRLLRLKASPGII